MLMSDDLEGRDTAYVDICPGCGARTVEAWQTECYACGEPYGDGKQWRTVEVDLDTDIILTTVYTPKGTADA